MPVLRLGVPDVFTDHGDPLKILSQLGLDAAGIEQSIRLRFAPIISNDAAASTKGLKLVG